MGALLVCPHEADESGKAGDLNLSVVLSVPQCSSRAILVTGIGEWFFGLFLFAGYYKADPRLAFLQAHADLTLFFFTLSFLAFLYRLLKGPSAQKIPFAFAKVAAFFLLLAGCILGGLFVTQSEGYGLDKAMRFVVLTGWAFFGAGLIVTDFASLRRFSWALVSIFTVMAIDALVGYPGVGRVNFVTALGSNYIALGRASGLGLLTTLAFLLPTERRPLARVFLWAMAALQLFAALSAGARGPVLALILSLLVFFALGMRGFPPLRADRFAWRLGIVALFTVVLVGTIGQKFFPTLTFRTQVFMTEFGDSAIERLYLYQEAIRLWLDSPILGVGTGGFGLATTGIDERLYPHNIILELGAETGLVGVLIFVIMVWAGFSVGSNGLRNRTGFGRTTARYLLAAGCFALVNAMISGDINDNRLLFMSVALLNCTPRFQTSLAVSASVGPARHSSPIARLNGAKEVQV